MLYCLCEWICVIQMPIFFLLWSLGYERKGIIMKAFYNYHEYQNLTMPKNNSTGDEFEQNLHAYIVTRNRESLLLFILCTCFALIYMILARFNSDTYDILETAIDNTECSFSSSSYKGTYNDIKNLLYASRLCFWSYQFIYYYVFLCVLLGYLHSSKYLTEDKIMLYSLIKTLCIHICCNTDPYLKRTKCFIFIILALYICITYSTTYWYMWTMRTTHLFFLCIFQTILEIFLIGGHQGDTETTFMTSLNCRLFYVTLSSLVMQSLVLVDPKRID